MNTGKKLAICSLILAIIGAFFGFFAVWRIEQCFDGGVAIGFPKNLRGFWWDKFGFISLGFIASGFVLELIAIKCFDNAGESNAAKEIDGYEHKEMKTVQPAKGESKSSQ